MKRNWIMSITERAFRAIVAIRERGSASRFGTQFAIDAVAWILSLVFAATLRYNFNLRVVNWIAIAIAIAVALVAQFVIGWLLFLYRGRHPYGSFAEVRSLFATVFITGILVGLPLALVDSLDVPRSLFLIGAPIAFLLMGSARYLKRLVVERAMRPGAEGDRTLIYGAGYLGASIVRRMLSDRLSGYVPVGLIDDDPTRRHVWFDGVRVLGTGADLLQIAQRTGATVLVIAIGKADAALLSRITDAALATNLQIKVLPPLEELLAGKSRLRDLRDISIEDLLGRTPVDTQMESIAGYLRGKRVLVTGAGGSIGSELCRQIHRFGPAELIMLDHDETALQATQLSIFGRGLLDTEDVVLASVRDPESMTRIFEARRPQVVFHAAAHKHLPLLEKYPEEAWKSNVLGTLNVLAAALQTDVETFVNVSTDKAANAISVLGRSKRMAEGLTAWAAETSGRCYLSVRFGNVLGSRGSILPVFAALIDAGGPVTITHPEVTRFFMTIPEACQLVIQAGAIGESGNVMILDMGRPVKILDIAHRMIEMSGSDVSIVFTGLRPGEKLHEDLVDSAEIELTRTHPKIRHASVAAIAPSSLSDYHSITADGDSSV